MELVNIDVVGLKLFQTEVQVLLGGFRITSAGLGCDNKVFSIVFLYRFSYTYFAVGITVSRVDEVDTEVDTFLHNFNRAFFGKSLDRDSTKAYFGYH